MSTSNIAASIRQRLLNRARQDKRPFNELLQYYAMERFLYRLSQSAHAECFILKGALMLRVWQAPEVRPTMDIDMLGKTDNSAEALLTQIREVLTTAVEDDGLEYVPDSLQPDAITEGADYQGQRLRFTGTLAGARVTLQLDIGFGDAVHPAAELATFPTLLDLPAPHLLCYSRESAIAEKFQAMVSLGDLNSRMKDFYDIWLLARQFDFDSAQLAEAIGLTFSRRGTALPGALPFGPDFIAAKQTQWLAFHKRLQQPNLPEQFTEVVKVLAEFLTPFLAPSDTPESYTMPKNWLASGPWCG